MLTKLTSLYLGGNRVTDAGLKYLKPLTNLKTLRLQNVHVTDAGLENIKAMTNLTILDLRRSTRVTDAGLKHLHGLTNLQQLLLERTKVTPSGVADLRKALPNCKIVDGPVAEPAPAPDEFVPLFNDTDFAGWQKADGKPVTAGWIVKDGAIVRNSPGGDIWTKGRYGDFVLELEFKTAGNSGVFVRTDDPKDNVQTGIEVQVDVPRGKPDRHSVGAIYDLVTPTRDNAKKDDWNRLKITAQGSKLTVEMNDEPVVEMDLDRWTQGNKNPDGSPNKYKTALKDFKHEGHVGLQDHGAAVMYRNITIRELK